jgi:hypothetical protein
MMTLKKVIVGFSVWLWWMLASIVGLMFGLLLTFWIFNLLKFLSSDLSVHIFTYVSFPSVGLVLGFFQSLVIRTYLLRSKRWILANALSFTVSMFLGISLGPILEPMIDYPYIGFAAVLFASLFLWLIIRRQFTRSLGWALVSGIGLITFFYAMRNVGDALGHSSGQYIVGDFLTFAISSGITSGAVSGLVMVFLLGPILSKDSYLIEGLVRLTEVSVYSKRPGIEAEEGLSSGSSFAKFMLVKMGLPIFATALLVLALTLTGPSYPHYYENTGLEITPQEFAAARALWAERSFSHYRLVATYHHNIDYCYEDVEIQGEKVVHIYEEDCEALGLKSVSDIYDLFEDYVGNEATRPPVGNGCSYYYVDAIFDDQLGYPHSMETHDIINVSERKQYVSRAVEFSCSTFLPVQYAVKIESLTPLP